MTQQNIESPPIAASAGPTCSPSCCSVCGDVESDLDSCDLCGKVVCDNCCDWTHDEHDYDCGQTVCSSCEAALPIRGTFDDDDDVDSDESEPVGSCDNWGSTLHPSGN